MNENEVAKFLEKIEFRDNGREETHIKQVEYLGELKPKNYRI